MYPIVAYIPPATRSTHCYYSLLSFGRCSLCAVASLITVSCPSFSPSFSLLTLLPYHQFVVAGNTFLYIGFFFCIGRRKSSPLPPWLRPLSHSSNPTLIICRNPLCVIVYTNSLLATLNARKRIRSAGSAIHTPSNISLSMRDFPTTASVALRVRSGYTMPLPSSGALEFTEKPDDLRYS